jgi:thiol-disulfide isomerase/thioredoxin
MRVQFLLKRLALGVAVAALIFGLSSAPRAWAADDRLQFSGTTLSGAPFNGGALGGKRSVLWFWTPWCPFCNAEAPGLSQVAAANPGVTFVGVAARSDPGAMQNFVSKYHLNFTMVNDADGSIWARYNGRGSRRGCSTTQTARPRSSTTRLRRCPNRSCPIG